jgi:hypothetical protein
MNIHKLNAVGFWPLLDGNGTHVATVWGTWEAAETLKGALLPTGSVVPKPALTAREPVLRWAPLTPGKC